MHADCLQHAQLAFRGASDYRLGAQRLLLGTFVETAIGRDHLRSLRWWVEWVGKDLPFLCLEFAARLCSLTLGFLKFLAVAAVDLPPASDSRLNAGIENHDCAADGDEDRDGHEE